MAALELFSGSARASFISSDTFKRHLRKGIEGGRRAGTMQLPNYRHLLIELLTSGFFEATTIRQYTRHLLCCTIVITAMSERYCIVRPGENRPTGKPVFL